MTADPALAKRILETLPDIPRWVETRAPLIHGDCDVLGFGDEPLSFVVVDRATRLAAITGLPPAEAIREAVGVVSEQGDVLAQEDNAEHALAALPGWSAETGLLHLLADESALHRAALPERVFGQSVEELLRRPPLDPEAERRADVRVVTAATLAKIERLSAETRDELSRALLRWPVVAAYTPAGEAAAVAYAAAPTESLWDVSVETLEPYRRQGYASSAVKFLVDLMWEQRKRPVWGALESNAASLALARKLGFRQVDTLVVLHAPGT